ncbi:MAG: response regulator transcription factor [Oscillospiraceae bacterium]|nr:response regulator transcription factor [Oscillospiraceae bacterium]
MDYKDLTVLIVDDDREIVKSIEIYLKNEGLNTLCAYNGLEALKLLSQNTVHLILMDIMMPVMSGIEATLKIRESYNIPIIMVSAKGEDTDKIIGLNLGADDYIVKPFNPLELAARVKSALRRYTALGGGMQEEKDEVYTVDSLSVNNTQKQVYVDGESVRLTPIEYRILLLLIQNTGRVFSIDEIYEKVWNEPCINADNTVAVHIRRIREKIEIDPKNPRYVKVVWGLGYKIDKA